MGNKKSISAKQLTELLTILKERFTKNINRHKAIAWTAVQAKLEACQSGKQTDTEKLWSLYEMEITGGEPDLVDFDIETSEYIFYDCSAESPKGRRSICYDQEALETRKENKPANSATKMAADMGIEILSEEQYKALQKIGNFDTKTSSWIITAPSIRKLGGALFADYRYDHVFIYHNGAESYYASRGFRGSLRI